jgi:hypothetical protein
LKGQNVKYRSLKFALPADTDDQAIHFKGVHTVIWGAFKPSEPGKLPSAPSTLMGIEPSDSLAPEAGEVLGAAAQSPWRLACDNYAQWLKYNKMPRSEAFKNFGALHVAVAEILWEQRDELQALSAPRVVHLSNSAGLVAVYSMAQHSVQVRMHNTALAQVARTSGLSFRIMPSSAGLLEGSAASDFQTHSLASLLWHYAQSAPQALLAIPHLQQQMLGIRRFPQLEPSSLQLRHLRLIHRLSRESLLFEALQDSLPPEDAALICPDLAALYFTGALRLKAQPA